MFALTMKSDIVRSQPELDTLVFDTGGIAEDERV
jgi:hypothetical protein